MKNIRDKLLQIGALPALAIEGLHDFFMDIMEKHTDSYLVLMIAGTIQLSQVPFLIIATLFAIIWVFFINALFFWVK